LVEEVHQGSEQQAKGIEQIARAVARMEQVTQQLAANAEQGAAAGHDLQRQAHAVDDLGRTLQSLVGADANYVTAHMSPKQFGKPSHSPEVKTWRPLPTNWNAKSTALAKTKFSTDFAKPEALNLEKSPEALIPFEEDFTSTH